MIDIEEKEERTIVRPTFDVVANRVGEIRDAILNISARGGRHVVLDLSRVKVVDSMGIGVVVACLKTLKQRGGDLQVYTDNEDLIKLFSVLKLDYVLVGSPTGATK